jgi:hypothetical protein
VAAGEQVRLVAVIGERPRLAHQPVDDVAVVDLVLATPTQTRQLLHTLLGVPDLKAFGVQTRLDPLADQPAAHRVDIALHMDDAARLHPYPLSLAGFQAAGRQRPQQRQFLAQPRRTPGIAVPEPLPQEGGIGVPAGEVPAAPQHQGLVQRPLELVVALLDVAVLVAFTSLDGLTLQAVVPQQGLVALLESLGPLDAWLDGGRQTVGTVQGRHAAQFPQGVLQALAEALQALGETDRASLPVGVGEHEVINHVRKRHAAQSDVQVVAVGEIAGPQSAGVMDLAEEDFLGGPALGPPAFEAALQGSQLAVSEGAGIATLQIGEEGFGLQAGVKPE